MKKKAQAPQIIIGYKSVRTDMTSFYDPKYKYTVSKQHVTDIDPDYGTRASGTGLHFCPTLEAAEKYAVDDYIILEVQSLKSDILGQDNNRFRTRKLLVNKVLSTTVQYGESWETALANLQAIQNTLIAFNKAATPQKITAIVTVFNKTAGYKKNHKAHIIDNIFEADAALKYTDSYYDFFGDMSHETENTARELVKKVKFNSHNLPIETHRWNENMKKIFASYLAAHEGNGDERELEVVQPYVDLLSIGCFPIGWGSKAKFLIFKPKQNINKMENEF